MSVLPSKIIAIGKLASATLLQDITERLREIGHQVEFFEDSNAFHDGHASLVDADVAVLAPKLCSPRHAVCVESFHLSLALQGLTSTLRPISIS
jgi:hypothetical protein